MPAATVERDVTPVGGRTAITPTRQMKTCETTGESLHVAGIASPTLRVTAITTATTVGIARTRTETETTHVDTALLAPTVL
jgi:hypothetical protein